MLCWGEVFLCCHINHCRWQHNCCYSSHPIAGRSIWTTNILVSYTMKCRMLLDSLFRKIHLSFPSGHAVYYDCFVHFVICFWYPCWQWGKRFCSFYSPADLQLKCAGQTNANRDITKKAMHSVLLVQICPISLGFIFIREAGVKKKSHAHQGRNPDNISSLGADK